MSMVPGKVHVVRLVAEGNHRHQKDVAFRLLRRRFADGPDQEIVGIQRQMRAVILNGSDRQHHYRLSLRNIAQFRPGVMLVQILFTIHKGLPWIAAFRGSMISHNAAPIRYIAAAA